MRLLTRLILLSTCVWIFALVGCTSSTPTSRNVAPLILISMDAFRWDYIQKYPAETPHLQQLKVSGVSARALIPVYPSNTFPNHYSIVTGLYPSHHGIINNHFFDAARGEYFHYNQVGARAAYWWGGEPIWVTASKQGRKSAASYWVGSEAEIQGIRPTFFRNYDTTTPFETRFEELFSWLHLPEGERPSVILFYFEETNSAGHKFGADSPELASAIKLLDGRIGKIMDRLKSENLPANLVIVSDHGMTSISKERVMFLDDFLDLNQVQIDFEEPAAGLRPLGDMTVDQMMQALTRLPHGKAYRAEELPARFHVTVTPRTPPVWIVPEEGWEIEHHATFAKYKTFNRGDHGFDSAFLTMRGILIAHGPAFRSDGTQIEPIENIHIYNLLCAALQLKPAANDGDDRLVRAMLRK